MRAFRLALVACGLLGASCSREPAPQNLVLISIDTLRPDHLSTYGYARDTSPTIDALAREGTRFTAAFAQAPWTIPSHASMLSGRYPCVHGADESHPIPASIPMLAERLHAAGFRTAGIVEETGFLSEQHGFGRGFDVYQRTRRADPNRFAVLGQWLSRRREDHERFFLFWHRFGAHGPYEPPFHLAQRYRPPRTTPAPDPVLDALRDLQYSKYLRIERYWSFAEVVADYDAAIRNVDDGLLYLVEQLRKLGLYERTAIVVTADHGESLFDHGLWVGHALFLTDDEIRVPLVVRPGGGRVARPVFDTVVESVDIVPTVMDLLGLPVPTGIEGQSLARLIRTGDDRGLVPRAFGMSSGMGNMPYLRTPDWKYIGRAGVPLERILLTHLQPKPGVDVASRVPLGEQLYDLRADPGEQTNVVAERPDEANALRLELAHLMAGCSRPKEVGTVTIDPQERERLRALGYTD
jgi:arylsulfatase A-like enzyme